MLQKRSELSLNALKLTGLCRSTLISYDRGIYWLRPN